VPFASFTGVFRYSPRIAGFDIRPGFPKIQERCKKVTDIMTLLLNINRIGRHVIADPIAGNSAALSWAKLAHLFGIRLISGQLSRSHVTPVGPPGRNCPVGCTKGH